MKNTHPVDERFFGEWSGSVHRLAIVLGSPRSRVDVDVAGEEVVQAQFVRVSFFLIYNTILFYHALAEYFIEGNLGLRDRLRASTASFTIPSSIRTPDKFKIIPIIPIAHAD